MPSPPRHVLITGGSRGIGLSIAQAFAAQNYRCTLISRSEAALQTAISSLTPPSTSAHRYIPGSISSPSFWTTTNFKESGLDKGDPESRIDVLVNCAGITQSRLFTTTPEDEIRQIVDTNLTGLMLGTRFLLRNKYLHSTRRMRGEEATGFTPSVVNVASLLGVSGGYGAVAYAASKAGVLGFTRALAGEYVGHGVRVNAIVPGYVESDMTKDLNTAQLQDRIPLKRFGRPEEIAHAALFLAENHELETASQNLCEKTDANMFQKMRVAAESIVRRRESAW
ncbi:hypothetical protein E8E13_003504 [Curvularia kusanoi]|uniref:NAD(P)-binding protein n=1 Tax=Curvularia kusanoi TaxID=90978 RepID=A0A9P4T7H5_CURKU|nr:hypothetical protein E8E13_003504 [Curvularia kusanoi]